MSARNMKNIIAKTKMNERYEMDSGELWELAGYPDNVEAIADAFVYGYALGQRALRAELQKKDVGKIGIPLKVV